MMIAGKNSTTIPQILYKTVINSEVNAQAAKGNTLGMVLKHFSVINQNVKQNLVVTFAM